MTTKQALKKNEKRVYTYFSLSEHRQAKVYCDYVSYLYLKMCYGKGLTEKQYQAYRQYNNH